MPAGSFFLGLPSWHDGAAASSGRRASPGGTPQRACRSCTTGVAGGGCWTSGRLRVAALGLPTEDVGNGVMQVSNGDHGHAGDAVPLGGRAGSGTLSNVGKLGRM